MWLWSKSTPDVNCYDVKLMSKDLPVNISEYSMAHYFRLAGQYLYFLGKMICCVLYLTLVTFGLVTLWARFLSQCELP